MFPLNLPYISPISPQVPSREMRRRSFQMAVQQSAGGALGGSKLADVADLATADASRHGGQLTSVVREAARAHGSALEVDP